MVKVWLLTHWGRMTRICVGNLTIIGSDNGLSPGRRHAINWTNVGMLLIGPLGTNLSEMVIEIHTFSFKKIHLKMSSWKWRPFCFGLNALSSRTKKTHSTMYTMSNKHQRQISLVTWSNQGCKDKLALSALVIWIHEGKCENVYSYFTYGQYQELFQWYFSIVT